MDRFGGVQLKKLFKKDDVHHDNLLFKLHHQVNFFVILVGVLFIFGENYLNGKAIVCLNTVEYDNQYCWLHGTGHISKALEKAMDRPVSCTMDQAEVTKDDDRETHYYLWLPFVLAICMGLVKLPRTIWKSLCERGLMKSLVGEGTEQNRTEKGEKIANRFKKLRKRSATVSYHVCFAACELLNIVMLIICFHILDSLLNGKFWRYGIDVNNYYATKLAPKEHEENKGLPKPTNPMCNLFPTEVACNLCTGAITGGCDDKSKLCILSNNLFNQYFFLILWFWWIILLAISVLGLVYRAAQISMPAISKAVFQSYLTPLGLENKIHNLSLRPSDYFLLGRLAINVKGSTMEEVVDELFDTKVSDENMELTSTA